MAFNTKRQSTKQAAEAGYEFEPKYPNSLIGIGAKITVRGPQSAAVRSHAQAKVEVQRAKALNSRRGEMPKTVTFDEADAEAVDAAVSFTMGWTGMQDGEEGPLIPFTPEAARSLYVDHDWIRDQVIAEASNLGNFIKPPSQNSSSTPAPSSDST